MRSDRLRLTRFEPGQPGSSHWLEPGRSYRVGRDPEAEIHLPDHRVSRIHLVIQHTDNGWQLSDQASKNGTHVNGRLVDHASLDDRAWISIGGVPAVAQPVSQSQQRTEKLQKQDIRSALKQLSNSSSAQQTIRGLVLRHLDAIRQITGCERCGIWLIEPHGSLQQALLHGSTENPLSLSQIHRVVETAEPVFASDLEGAEQLACSHSIQLGGIRAIVAQPLSIHEPVDGVLYADSTQAGKLFTELDAELLSTITRQIELALASMSIRAGIEALADTDGEKHDFQVKGLLNRVFRQYRSS